MLQLLKGQKRAVQKIKGRGDLVVNVRKKN